jgi:hypothetical protein
MSSFSPFSIHVFCEVIVMGIFSIAFLIGGIGVSVMILSLFDADETTSVTFPIIVGVLFLIRMTLGTMGNQRCVSSIMFFRCTYFEVLSAVIEGVTIEVIDVRPLRRTRDKAMHADVNTRSFTDAGNRVTEFSVPRRMPLVTLDERKVLIVDDGILILSERNAYNHVELIPFRCNVGRAAFTP